MEPLRRTTNVRSGFWFDSITASYAAQPAQVFIRMRWYFSCNVQYSPNKFSLQCNIPCLAFLSETVFLRLFEQLISLKSVLWTLSELETLISVFIKMNDTTRKLTCATICNRRAAVWGMCE